MKLKGKRSPFVLKRLLEMFKAFRDREHNFINRQRQVILMCYSVVIMVAVSSNILGISGAFHPFFTTTNAIVLVAFLIFTGCYMGKMLSLVRTLSLMTVTLQFFIAADTVYSAVDTSLQDNLMVILVNMVILATNIIISLSTYLTRTTQIMVGIALATYIACMAITRNSALADYFFMLLLILLLISFLGFHIIKNAKRLSDENHALKREEAELLQILRLNKKQVKAYIALAKQEHSVEHASRLLDLLGEKSQKILMANVVEYMRQNETESGKLKQLFPELTPSEIRICQLILRDKKLSEICAMLNKTESNINTQRANIRKKLGLQSTDNLQEALRQRMKQ